MRVFVNVGRLAAALVLAGSGVVLGQLPAHACTCVAGTTQTHTKAADEVFSGTIADVTSERKAESRRGATMTYDVDVERVYKGDIASPTVQVTSARSAAACGLGRLPVDRRYVFFARADGAGLSADSCGGTDRATNELVTKVERLLGEGHAPVPPEPEKAEFTRVADAEPDPFSRIVAPGVALALAGLLGLFVVRRLGRRA